MPGTAAPLAVQAEVLEAAKRLNESEILIALRREDDHDVAFFADDVQRVVLWVLAVNRLINGEVSRESLRRTQA